MGAEKKFKKSKQNEDLYQVELLYQNISTKFVGVFKKKLHRVLKIPAVAKFPSEQMIPMTHPSAYICLERDTLIGISEGNGNQQAKRIFVYHKDKSQFPPVRKKE